MERMDLYDAQRRPLGRTAERGEKLPEGIYHLMAHILVFHPDGRILIQRRQPFKKYWSGLWDITTGGGALAGEDTARAAMAAGAIAMESTETINPDMSARLLRRRAGFGEGVETP